MTPKRRVPPQAGPSGLICSQDAERAGWTSSAMRHANRTGRWPRERRGVYVIAEPEDGPEDPLTAYEARREKLIRTAMAAALACPRAVLGSTAAAAACDIPYVGRSDRACLTVSAGTALRDLDGVHLHRAGLPADQVISCGRYAMTVPARTALDIAREFGIDAGVVAIDAVLHYGLADAARFEAILRSCVRWPGKRRARAALELADPRSESPLESLSRLEILRAGLPEPRPQTWIYDQYGRFVARTDFGWPEFGVIGETDGLDKYRAGWDTVVEERRRERCLLDLGLEVVRWGWADLKQFAKVVAEIRAAIERRASSDRPRLWQVGPE